MAVRKRNKLVYGVGINDADYEVFSGLVVGGKNTRLWSCPFYQKWMGMIGRCYNPRELARRPAYQGCTVCSGWLLFSSFKLWMIDQDYHGNELDKDILIDGNRVYSPDTCVFISPDLNKFLTYAKSDRGEWPTGVSWNRRDKRFQATCNNPFTGKRDRLGDFFCPEKAYQAWRERKHQHACRYADMQTDPRIANALKIRFSTDKDYSNAIT
jgi:hypothetical protein